MTDTDWLADLLAAHKWTWRALSSRYVLVCTCGDELIPATSSGVAGLADHCTHLAAVIRAAIHEGVDGARPTWHQGMYGCRDDMFTRATIKAAL